MEDISAWAIMERKINLLMIKGGYCQEILAG